MLTGRELALAIAAVLLAAVGLGALLHWLWTRLGRAGRNGDARLAEMAQRLRQAEADRDAAERAHEATAAEFSQELGETQAELEATREALDRARERVRALEAELDRAREG